MNLNNMFSLFASMPNNGWSDEDCMRFRHVINQYNSVPNKRRQLYLHRLKIELPHKSSAEIVRLLQNFYKDC